MTQASSPSIQKAIDWLWGEDAVLHKPIPQRVASDLAGKHVNELLGRHPYYPWDPAMPRDHPCKELNDTFGQCMHACPKEMKTHMKHVTCFEPHKTALMKCLVSYKRAQRERASAES